MKNKRIISTLLSLMMLLTFVGCNKGSNPSGEQSSIDALRVVYNGTHKFNVETTDKDFVKDEFKVYKQVFPDSVLLKM